MLPVPLGGVVSSIAVEVEEDRIGQGKGPDIEVDPIAHDGREGLIAIDSHERVGVAGHGEVVAFLEANGGGAR